MSTQNRQPPGRPTGGEYAATVHGEASFTLSEGPAVDAHQVVVGIVKDLRGQRHRGTAFTVEHADLFFGLRSKKADPVRLLAQWTSLGGRCPRHAASAEAYPEDHCVHCTLAAMATARTSPAPVPVPVGAAPARPEPVHLEDGPSTVIDQDETSSETQRELTGDEQVEAAVRRMFGAPDGTSVTIVQQEWKDWSSWTGDYATEIEVICGDQKMAFDGLGELTRSLAAASRPETVKTALRFAGDPEAQWPLLQGPAAVYVSTDEHTDPVPVFGRVIDCHPDGRDPYMEFAHLDGRRENIPFADVVAIHETDQSSVYEEQ